jgi:hypothetical protein
VATQLRRYDALYASAVLTCGVLRLTASNQRDACSDYSRLSRRKQHSGGCPRDTVSRRSARPGSWHECRGYWSGAGRLDRGDGTAAGVKGSCLCYRRWGSSAGHPARPGRARGALKRRRHRRRRRDNELARQLLRCGVHAQCLSPLAPAGANDQQHVCCAETRWPWQIIDFVARPGSALPPGVRENRGGNGIPPAIVNDELKASAFNYIKTIAPWPPDGTPPSYFLALFE